MGDDMISDYFPVNTGVRQGCDLAPTTLYTYLDHVLGRMSEKFGVHTVVRGSSDH